MLRHPARLPARQGCAPAATRISASCPGATAAGGLLETPGDTGGHRGTWGRRARVAQPSPHPLLLAGCARARCATRAPWTWASRGGAACSATSRGTRRLREPRGGAVPLRLGARGLRAAPGTPGFGAEMFSARPARGEGNKPGPASPAPPVWSVRRQHGGGGQGDGGTGVSEPSPRGLSFSGVSQALPRPGVEGSWPTAPVSCQACLGKSFPRHEGDGLALQSCPEPPKPWIWVWGTPRALSPAVPSCPHPAHPRD